MNEPDSLHQLAQRAGIQCEYTDVWGRPRTTSAATRKALLAAMGLPAATDAQARASLDQLLARQRQLLQPVYVVRCDEPVGVILPEPPPPQLHWQVEVEDGTHAERQVATNSLPLLHPAEAGATQRALACTGNLPWGYHRLQVTCGEQEATARLIVVPDKAWQPRPLRDGGRRWGLSLQLYGVRSRRNWGIGDFTDLTRLVTGAGHLGAAAVGINPLHALCSRDSDNISPYSPSSRLFLNPLYLDIEAIPEFADCTGARRQVTTADLQTRLYALRKGELVDYAAVAALKWPLLELLYEHFREQAESLPERLNEFRAFQRRRGPCLRSFAVFNALAKAHGTAHWREWPQAYRDRDAGAVAEFAARHQEQIGFHEYLQWQAERQLAAAGTAACAQGMEIGIYADLAVGADPNGAEAWDMQHALATGVTVGAPPDALNLAGQDWGLPPLVPAALRECGYQPFIDLLRANMAQVGALRIDHVLGLLRLYWIPDGAEPQAGAYVDYPFQDLIGLLALESHRNRCLVIGEDLGTVPPGLREALDAAGILSYRLLYFEKSDQGYRPPGAYPVNALVSVGTHDLPTLPAFWDGDDIELRTRLGLWPSPAERTAAIEARPRERAALSAALHHQGLLPDTQVPKDAPVEAAYRYLARSPCKLLMLQSEDVLGQREQVNVPGTVQAHPNWRQRLPVPLETLFAAPALRKLAAELNESRGPTARGNDGSGD